MRRQQDTIGNSRLWLSLLGVSTLALLSGCGWFGGGSPSTSQKARPGVDRQMPATGALPPATGQQHDSGVVPADPVGTPQIGSIVPAKGGQKAQKEATEKEALERDAKEREERLKREAEERDAKAKAPPEPVKATPPAAAVPSKPAAAERGDAAPAATGSPPPMSGSPPPGATAPPPAPVTSAPVAPPPQLPPAAEQPAAPPRT
jgi:hypothetical protein